MKAVSFRDALHSGGPAPDREAKMGLYAWLIGDWDMDSVLYAGDVRSVVNGGVQRIKLPSFLRSIAG